jgi:hypothetical protein
MLESSLAMRAMLLHALADLEDNLEPVELAAP